MKRIPKLLLATITPALLFNSSGPVRAAIRENDTTWWSVDELLEFYQEVELEKEIECGDNQDCRIEFGFNMIEKGPKYSALENLMQGQIWITSVNPTEETLKVLFFDEDMMLKHMGITEYLTLEHLYFGWFDEWNGQIFNYDHDRFTSGAILGVHTLYDSLVADISAIIPWEETEISVTGGELYNNTSGIIDYAAFANFFNAQGTFNYSSCLSTADYEPGVECKMYVSGDQWVTYLPPREDIIEDEQDSDQTDTDDTETTVDSELETTSDTAPDNTDAESETEDTPEESTNDEPEIEDIIEEPTNNDLGTEDTLPELDNDNPETESTLQEISDNGTETGDTPQEFSSDDPETEETSSDIPDTESEVVDIEVADIFQEASITSETEEISETQTSTNEEKIYTPQPEVNSEAENQLQQPQQTLLPSNTANIGQEEQPAILSTAATLSPSTPNTGKGSFFRAGNSENFLLPLIIAGMAFIIWWFLPTRSQRERKKVQKKY